MLVGFFHWFFRYKAEIFAPSDKCGCIDIISKSLHDPKTSLMWVDSSSDLPESPVISHIFCCDMQNFGKRLSLWLFLQVSNEKDKVSNFSDEIHSTFFAGLCFSTGSFVFLLKVFFSS